MGIIKSSRVRGSARSMNPLLHFLFHQEAIDWTDDFIWLENSLGFLRFSYALSKWSFVKKLLYFPLLFFATVFIQNSYIFLYSSIFAFVWFKSPYTPAALGPLQGKKRHISIIELPRRSGWWGADALPYATSVASSFAFLRPFPRACQAPWSNKGNSS
jgi:hypothetical protein